MFGKKEEIWEKRQAVCSHCRAIIEVMYHGDHPWLQPVICEECVGTFLDQALESIDKIDQKMEKDNAEMAEFFGKKEE